MKMTLRREIIELVKTRRERNWVNRQFSRPLFGELAVQRAMKEKVGSEEFNVAINGVVKRSNAVQISELLRDKSCEVQGHAFPLTDKLVPETDWRVRLAKRFGEIATREQTKWTGIGKTILGLGSVFFGATGGCILAFIGFVLKQPNTAMVLSGTGMVLLSGLVFFERNLKSINYNHLLPILASGIITNQSLPEKARRHALPALDKKRAIEILHSSGMDPHDPLIPEIKQIAGKTADESRAMD